MLAVDYQGIPLEIPYIMCPLLGVTVYDSQCGDHIIIESWFITKKLW